MVSALSAAVSTWNTCVESIKEKMSPENALKLLEHLNVDSSEQAQEYLDFARSRLRTISIKEDSEAMRPLGWCILSSFLNVSQIQNAPHSGMGYTIYKCIYICRKNSKKIKKNKKDKFLGSP